MTGKKYSIVSQMVNLKMIYTWYKMLTRWWNTLLWLTLFLYIEGIVSILFATLIFKPPGPCSTKLSSSLRKSTFNAPFHTISLFLGSFFERMDFDLLMFFGVVFIPWVCCVSPQYLWLIPLLVSPAGNETVHVGMKEGGQEKTGCDHREHLFFPAAVVRNVMASESTPPKLPHLTPRKKALSMAYSPLVSLNKAGYYTPISGGVR